MVRRLKLAGVAIAAFAFLVGSQGAALAGKCASGEAKAIGKKASCKAGVFSKAAGKGLPADPLKLTKCETKYSTSYAKAQAALDCDNPGLTAAQEETKVNNFVNDLNSEIAVSPPSKCQAAKLKGAGKKASCLLGVDAKGLAKPPRDEIKHAACATKFSTAWAKAAGGTTCGASPTETTIENKVDAFEADIQDDVVPPPTTTTSTTTSTTVTTTSSTTSTTMTTTTTSTTTTSTTNTTTTTATTTTSTTTPPCCGFAAPGPTRLSFTTTTGTGNCGVARRSNGLTFTNLACGGLYTGGGGNTVPLPYAVPDQGQSLTGISSCNSGTNILNLTNLTSGQTGSNRNCTSVGCLFGPPLPIPNAGSPPTSVCVVNVVATNATGSVNCVTGASVLNLPLSSVLYLDGDLSATGPGIQACPVCNHTCNAGTNLGGPCNVDADCPSAGAGSCAGPNVCHAGPNDGFACTPADSAINQGFPTTHDCPPPGANNIGALPIAFNLGTGTNLVTAVPISSGQNNVFCGYCRDAGGGTSAGTGCFEGDPSPSCPHNVACVAAGNPYNCCTGAGTGSCDAGVIKACIQNGVGSSAVCTDGAGTWPDCQEKGDGAGNGGAFGPSGGPVRTITETGSPAGNMTDGLGHASTLVSIFCIQPTFNATVDAAGNLPGPGAVSLPGTTQLLP